MVTTTGFGGLEGRGRVSHKGGSGEIVLDFTKLPVFDVSYVGVVDDAAFERYLRDLVAVLDARAPYALLADASRSGPPSAKQRRLQAECIRDYEAGFARYCRGAAFVIDAPLIRGALTAILWTQRLPYDHVVVPTRADALAWIEPRLVRH